MMSEHVIHAAPHRWRVLEAGPSHAPVALCLHGAGGSAESFAGLAAQLSSRFHLIVPDLPGHNGTQLGAPNRSGLPQMAEDVARLLQTMEIAPDIIIGHSAGAAIALALDPVLPPRGHVLINAALANFDGLAGVLFPALARGLASAPFAADIASATLSREAKIKSLLASTGTEPTEEMVERYRALVRSPSHVKGALRMMAAWDLTALRKALPKIETPVLLIAGRDDGAVPCRVSEQASEQLPNADLVVMEGGHLLHETDPQAIADRIVAFHDGLAQNSAAVR